MGCFYLLFLYKMNNGEVNDGCDDEMLHRNAERVHTYYGDVMTRMLEEEFETTKHTMS